MIQMSISESLLNDGMFIFIWKFLNIWKRLIEYSYRRFWKNSREFLNRRKISSFLKSRVWWTFNFPVILYTGLIHYFYGLLKNWNLDFWYFLNPKLCDMHLHKEVIRQVRVAWGSVDISVRLRADLGRAGGGASWCSRDKETDTIHDSPTWKGISWNFCISTQKILPKLPFCKTTIFLLKSPLKIQFRV